VTHGIDTTFMTKEAFAGSCREGTGIPPLYAEIPYVSPEVLYPVFAGRHSFLFESVKGPEKLARYSFIGFEPHMIFQARGGLVEMQTGDKQVLLHAKPLNVLSEILGGYQQASLPHLPPFQGGAAGLLSYDFVHYLEKLPRTTLDDLHIPDAHFLIIDRLISFDHKEKKAWVVVCPGLRKDMDHDPGSWYEEAEYVLADICRRIGAENRGGSARDSLSVLKGIEILPGMKKREYTEMVKKAKEYIAAGDIFQANLSQRISASIGGSSPWHLYLVLRSINPSPFGGFMDFGDYFIASSSPERLVKVQGRVIETRPIAGTRPRGRDFGEDEKMRKELLLNEKERAEHIMLIDLERNDIGKVSEYGSVGVDELMITEDYSHVIHIVSNVRGLLTGQKTCLDALKATFPGGTITGVPKVRCMEIIDELEPVRRGPYTGSMGYVGFSGAMDMNIIIRTFVIRNGYAYVQAGAGIVADSDPEREYHETLKKAEALVKALGR
jgi:para-aminobenzoate synthetase component 1